MIAVIAFIKDALLGTLALTVLVLGGLAVLARLPRVPWATRWPARLALAHLIGAALMAWMVTTVGVLTGRLTAAPVYLLFAGLAVLAWRRPPAREPAPPRRSLDQAGGFWMWLAMAGVLLGVVAAGSGLLYDSSLAMDGYVIWAKKAKALFIDDSFQPLLDRCCWKPSYPTLFPIQSWWVYEHLRHVNTWWLQFTGFVFYLDLLALAFAACRARMAATWAWTATALIANSPFAVLLATRGQADGPLSAYILASTLLLVDSLADRGRNARIPALLMLLGALQTKNEGFAWTFFAVALLVLVEMRRSFTSDGVNERRVARRSAAVPLLCYAAAALPWMIFTRMHQLASGPDEPMATVQMIRGDWVWRIKTIFHYTLGDLSPAGLPFVLLLFLPLLWKARRRFSTPVLALFVAQYASYLLVCFIVKDPVYQAAGFIDRGLSQISPALLCVSLIAYQWRPDLRSARQTSEEEVVRIAPRAQEEEPVLSGYAGTIYRERGEQ